MSFIRNQKKSVKLLNFESKPAGLSIDHFESHVKRNGFDNGYKIRVFVIKESEPTKKRIVSKHIWRIWNLKHVFQNAGIECSFGYDPKTENACFMSKEKALQLFQINPVINEMPKRKRVMDEYNIYKTKIEECNFNFEDAINDLLIIHKSLNVTTPHKTLDYKNIRLFK